MDNFVKSFDVDYYVNKCKEKVFNQLDNTDIDSIRIDTVDNKEYLRGSTDWLEKEDLFKDTPEYVKLVVEAIMGCYALCAKDVYARCVLFHGERPKWGEELKNG